MLSRPAAQTGLLVAASIVPETFASSLTPRSWIDQGIVTGLATSLDYLLTVVTQDGVEALASIVAPHLPTPTDVVARQRSAALLLDLAVVPISVAVQWGLARRPDEPIRRGLARQLAWRVGTTCGCASLLAALQAGLARVDHEVGAGGRLARLPIAVPAGLALAIARDRLQQRGSNAPDTYRPVSTATLPSVAASAGVVGVLAGVAALEHATADLVGGLLGRVLPGWPQLWRLAGHGAFAAALAAGGGVLFDHTIRRLEAGTTAFEPMLDASVPPEWTGTTVSGGPNSLVPWATLGREGRRHAVAHVQPTPLRNRPPGVPDLCIETVMGQPAKATPVQVYIGLDSGRDARTRVELAMAELDRAEAWDRSVLMLISPTGTGYVNYCATAATEYLTLGDVATVTLQYSKRPSPLSLTRIGAAREQNRLLLLRVIERLRGRPSGTRPRVVLFGESLGAHTSQDVLMHWGTLGPQALGVDRALWIGTPYSSKWMRQVTGNPRPDVDPALVGVFNDFSQYATLAPEQARAVALRHGQPRQRRRHQVRRGSCLVPAALAPPRSPPDAGGPRRQSARRAARDAVAAGHHLPAHPHRHEERAGSRAVPGLRARLPGRPGALHQRRLRATGQRRAADTHRVRPRATRSCARTAVGDLTAHPAEPEPAAAPWSGHPAPSCYSPGSAAIRPVAIAPISAA